VAGEEGDSGEFGGAGGVLGGVIEARTPQIQHRDAARFRD